MVEELTESAFPLKLGIISGLIFSEPQRAGINWRYIATRDNLRILPPLPPGESLPRTCLWGN